MCSLHNIVKHEVCDSQFLEARDTSYTVDLRDIQLFSNNFPSLHGEPVVVC